MLPFSHHTTRHHSHLDREGVCIFDEEGLYSEALAECCSLVNSFQGYSLICVEAPGKVGPGRGERSGGEGRGGKEKQGEGRGGKMREEEEERLKKRKVDHIHVTFTREMSSCPCTHTHTYLHFTQHHIALSLSPETQVLTTS